jgi:hypothetical protein
VLARRLRRDREEGGDFRIAFTRGHPSEDFAFARGESGGHEGLKVFPGNRWHQWLDSGSGIAGGWFHASTLTPRTRPTNTK